MSNGKKDRNLALRIIANGISAFVAGYLYQAGSKLGENLDAKRFGKRFGNLLAGQDAKPADEAAEAGRRMRMRDL